MMVRLWLSIAVLALVSLAWAWRAASQRNLWLWLPSWVAGDWAGRRQRRARSQARPVHLIFCIADHFEPGWAEADPDTQRRRVAHWLQHYPKTFGGFRDADGRVPRHTFFYPAEEYEPEHLDALAELVRQGYGEVEVHLHHDNDTAEGLRETLDEFVSRLRSHGLLGERHGSPAFGFVHGNWALDNSRPDGRWCGVENELRVLRAVDCYADFTLPSAPSPTQTRRINSIYYAADDPSKPKSHDTGTEVQVGGTPTGDLMIIQGPLALNWAGGRFGLPYVENGDLASDHVPMARRVRAWVRCGVSVAGRPEWVFVKVHVHGCQERIWGDVFGERWASMHRTLCEQFNDGTHYLLHYVTAREMYNIIKAAEQGKIGNPGELRDFAVTAPAGIERPVTADTNVEETT